MRPFGPVGFWRSALHFGALWTLAFAAPLFDLLGDAPEFFVARDNSAADIVVFAVAYAFVPPLLAACAVGVVSRLRASAGSALQLLLVGLLVAALVLPPVGDALPGSVPAFAAALLVGALACVLYATRPGARLFLTVLSPAPLLFVAIFLVFSPVGELVLPSESEPVAAAAGPPTSSTPIVHIVLDELPTTTVTGADGQIDAALFPNLARLARTGTWYRNATTVTGTTSEAVPAQLTGTTPELGDLPTARAHPNSLFTLFRRSHDLEVIEPLTDVCPRALCAEAHEPAATRLRELAEDVGVVAMHLLLPAELDAALPAVDEGWADFGDTPGEAATIDTVRAARPQVRAELIARLRADDARVAFGQALAALEAPRRRPVLLFLHSTLPHSPWRYLPDGRAYTIRDPVNPGLTRRWTHRRWLIDQAFQRHVLQAQYTDRLVGRVLEKLTSTGVFEDAVIVVAADHGVSFTPGQPRRRPRLGNLPDIASALLIVKRPHQRRARVDAAAVRTVDILPTIAAAVGARVPWTTDGRPAGERRPDLTARIELSRPGRTTIARSLGELVRAWERRNRHEAFVLRHGVYGVGPRADLLGRQAPATVLARAGPRATIDEAEQFADVRLRDGALPALVTGSVTGVRAEAVLALAVNGRVAATTRAYPDADSAQLRYVALLPPSSLRAGANRVSVLEVQPGDRLRTIGETG